MQPRAAAVLSLERIELHNPHSHQREHKIRQRQPADQEVHVVLRLARDGDLSEYYISRFDVQHRQHSSHYVDPEQLVPTQILPERLLSVGPASPCNEIPQKERPVQDEESRAKLSPTVVEPKPEGEKNALVDHPNHPLNAPRRCELRTHASVHFSIASYIVIESRVEQQRCEDRPFHDTIFCEPKPVVERVDADQNEDQKRREEAGRYQ